MRILDRALARVRRGAKADAQDATAPNPPDSALGHALSWLGSELRGEVIPERLRGAAGRLASLLDPQPDLRAQAPRGADPVVALEDALRAKAMRDAATLPDDRTHAGDVSAGVCPFTGMRADGTLAVPAAPARAQAAPEASIETAREPAAPEPALAPAPKAPATRAKKRQKNKETLAGAQSVENTSGRSATRPARKQPRSRTQASRKKA